MRKTPPFALLALVLVGACAPAPRTLHPTVFVDASFTAAGGAGVHAALAAWETAAPEIHFTVVERAHANIVRDARNPAVDTIYIVRVETDTDQNCPHAITPGAAGETLGSAICLVAPTVTRWKQVAMHEMGHALNLPHLPYPSCMTAAVSVDIESPTAGDVATLRARWSR